MSVFVVLGLPHENARNLPGAIARLYGVNSRQFGEQRWLVADANVNAQAVSQKLGIATGVNGTGYVFEIASYHGRAPTDVWDWIKSKWETTTSG